MSLVNALRLPLQNQINNAGVGRAQDVNSTNSLGLPCKLVSVADQLVTVAFTVSGVTLPNITVPVAQSLYSRAPLQPGDRGVVIAMDASLAEASGQAATEPTVKNIGNLSGLVFFPISSTKWDAMPDKNMYLLQGPNGFILRSLDGSVSVTGTKGSSLILASGSSKISLTSSGVAITGTLTINGQPYLSHTHTNGNQGSPTGGVIT